ncbi:MAG: acyl--CoA ligase, partial [Bdellovibrionales bacterium]|nr:acyl--CoA ligase [Bdellovibrionales bacterium]
MLERAAALVPERTAVDFMNHQWSYHQIHDASLRLATWLQSRGIQPGDRVAVLLPNSPEYLIALNGIWRASAIAVAISPLAVPEDVEQLLTLTDCHYVVCLDVLAGLLRECHDIHHLLLTSLYDYLPSWKRVGYLATRWHRSGSMHLIRSRQQAWFSEILKMSSPNPRSLAIESPTEPAYILSTGGTTGCPKAVTLSHRNIV